MGRLKQDTFRIFISHKHADKEFAELVARELETLAPEGSIDCWVSGQDITAGEDWDQQIRNNLAQSHLLILLFTTPAQQWDWCLYEVGLFIRFETRNVSSVVCLYDPSGLPPGPLRQVQGVPVDAENLIIRLLRPLCMEPWRVSDDWQRGALVPQPDEARLSEIAGRIVDGFSAVLKPAAPDSLTYAYRPCHRIVLDLGDAETTKRGKGIPLTARVVEGSDNTTSYTLSLFHLHEGPETRTWGDLVRQVEGRRAPWLQHLNQAFADSLRQKLWSPSSETVQLTHPGSAERHPYMPVLYEVKHRSADHAPVEVTIVLVPMNGHLSG